MIVCAYGVWGLLGIEEARHGSGLMRLIQYSPTEPPCNRRLKQNYHFEHGPPGTSITIIITPPILKSALSIAPEKLGCGLLWNSFDHFTTAEEGIKLANLEDTPA